MKLRAFTLIELLIVITIIGVLAVALIPKIANAPSRARDTQRKTDLNQIVKALEAYYADYGVYPTGTPTSRYCVDAIASFSNYFNASDIPNDPSGPSGGVSSTITSCSTGYLSTGEYFYKQLDSGAHYVIAADLENEPPSGSTIPSILIDDTVTGATTLGNVSDTSSLYYKMQTGEDCASSGCLFVMVK